MTGHLVARQPGAAPSTRSIVDAMVNVLEVSDLAIRFGSTVVFRGLSFAVPAGSSLAVIGPNGSGKTVLFKALVGSIPYDGTVRWAPGVRIGYVPQKLDLDRDLPITGHDLLRAKAALTQGAADIADATAAVGLGAELDRRIGALSGGQFQRLLVAMAMVGQPTVLLLDEPTAGIDEPGQERLNELVGRLRRERGLTSLVISHELSVVYQHATTVLCLGGERSSMHDAGAIIASIAMAIPAGMIGCFAVMRRMALASDAISHVALPGIGIALALGIHPLFGAVAMLAFGALTIWAVERRTRMATETVIGVVFSVALAIGSLLSSGDDLIDALFGARGPVGPGELVFGLAAAFAIVRFAWWARNRLVLVLVSPEIAMTAGIRVARLDLWFLEAFALTVALGLHYLGVLLMGPMIIIPAATAKRLARNLSGMLVWATAVAVASTSLGAGLAIATQRPPGPVIVCVATALFVVSLFVRRA